MMMIFAFFINGRNEQNQKIEIKNQKHFTIHQHKIIILFIRSSKTKKNKPKIIFWAQKINIFSVTLQTWIPAIIKKNTHTKISLEDNKCCCCCCCLSKIEKNERKKNMYQAPKTAATKTKTTTKTSKKKKNVGVLG